jgi:hypothetical protein
MTSTNRCNPAAEFHTVESCYITELRNTDEDQPENNGC